MTYSKIDNMLETFGFLKASREFYAYDWPKVNLTLTDKQVKKYKQADMQALVSKFELIANNMNQHNRGIIGSTKYSFECPNQLCIQGSLTVLELIIGNIFR
ncbi:hypothetical protein [Intestinibacter bartlettii]|mgnify:CR=1 FL=1|uniref:hypothetical protein n=1 Tax=Intestinibacter bartlettii TaxID=261299 RepID=UPI003991B35D